MQVNPATLSSNAKMTGIVEVCGEAAVYGAEQLLIMTA
jgi:hypothetical protein